MSRRDDDVDIVSRFLRLVEARRLDEASDYLAPDVQITFPGARRFRDLEEQVASMGRRFRSIGKVFEGVDTLERDGVTVVYIHGTLEGDDVDGVPFSGVRFIDRFEVRAGRIVDHRVWNDMAEAGIARTAQSITDE